MQRTRLEPKLLLYTHQQSLRHQRLQNTKENIIVHFYACRKEKVNAPESTDWIASNCMPLKSGYPKCHLRSFTNVSLLCSSFFFLFAFASLSGNVDFFCISIPTCQIKNRPTNSSAEELRIKSIESAPKVRTFDRRVSRIARCKAVRGFFFLPMDQKLKLNQ